MYYLKSRFYDPEIRRFLNPDKYASTGLGDVEKNMYVYCLNDPENNIDPTGNACVCLTHRVSSRHVCYDPEREYVVRTTSKFAKNESESLPSKGNPNSSRILPNPDGTPKQKRWYGPDGNAIRDRDYNHPGNMEFPHDHSWENGKRNRKNDDPSPDYEFSMRPLWGIGVVTICGVGMALVAADNALGIGLADDFLLAPLSTGVGKGLIMIFG